MNGSRFACPPGRQSLTVPRNLILIPASFGKPVFQILGLLFSALCLLPSALHGQCSCTVADLVFPADRTGNAALDCANPNISPENTGQPLMDGQPLGDLQCGVSAIFNDQNIPACGNSRAILRTWTAIDWCTDEIRSHLQTIWVVDQTPPTLACPPDWTVGTGADDCFAALVLPAAQVSDACSAPVSLSFSATAGTLNGQFLTNAPPGQHAITYTATDACGNASTCSAQMTVEDQIAPSVVCVGTLSVSLNGTGTATVQAKAFDSGSMDNCCAAGGLVFQARLATDTVFSSKITFDCGHIGQPQTAILRVTDCAGNANECAISVNVRDQTRPVINCPAGASVTCNVFNINDLSAFGMAGATDNCSNPTVQELPPDGQNLTGCGTGQVVRWFQATDAGGRVATCSQTITVVNPADWDGTKNITWPSDFSTTQCTADVAALAPNLLPAGRDFPVLTVLAGCHSVSYSFEDQLFMLGGTVPSLQILRRWKVVDWCRYDLNQPNGPGQWTHAQTISVALGDCPPTEGSIIGRVLTTQQQGMAGVAVRVGSMDSSWETVTDSAGNFEVGGLPTGLPYAVAPEKNGDWLNGVSTYDLLLISKHILGAQPLDSPFKLIAADANGSGSVTSFDILQLRRVILGLADSVPGNTSWRFVDARHTFANPANPFAEAFPEIVVFEPLAAPGGVADFVAVKIGDVNGSATAALRAQLVGLGR
ncbi:MAG: dockerin type I domain-containing protein [Saprospiraceae bacterium]